MTMLIPEHKIMNAENQINQVTNATCAGRGVSVSIIATSPNDAPIPPRRVQLSRRRGSRMPPNSVVVARPKKMGQSICRQTWMHY